MNEFTNITSGCELIVRKRIASFIEKMMRYIEYDFDHDVYKKIVYGEDMPRTPVEEKIKSYYDAYYYLLSNHKSPITKELLSKFFYILDGKTADSSMLLRLAKQFFDHIDLPPLESAIEFHLKAYKEMVELDIKERLCVSLMLFNYMLLRHNIPTIHILMSEFAEYEETRNAYLDGDSKPICEFMLNLIKKAKFQKREYYKNLKPLTVKEIFAEITKDKEMLMCDYAVKNIAIFGSFAKGNQRIDSDIDLFVSFSLDLTFEKKAKYIEYLSQHYFNIFNRFIDITEAGEYICDEYIKTMIIIKKIF